MKKPLKKLALTKETLALVRGSSEIITKLPPEPKPKTTLDNTRCEGCRVSYTRVLIVCCL